MASPDRGNARRQVWPVQDQLSDMMRRLMSATGLSQRKLAAAAGTCQSAVSALATGRYDSPRLATVERIAEACDHRLLVLAVPLDWWGVAGNVFVCPCGEQFDLGVKSLTQSRGYFMGYKMHLWARLDEGNVLELRSHMFGTPGAAGCEAAEAAIASEKLMVRFVDDSGRVEPTS